MRTLLLTLVASVVCAQSPQEKAWEVLNTGLTDKRVDRRAKAVRALGLTLRNERATTEAEKALTDPDAEIRAAGCIALGEMKSSASVPKLRDALGDEEAQVGVAATQALDMLGDPSALEAYYAILTGQRRAKGAFVDQQIRGFRDPRRLAKLGFEQGIGFIPFAGMGYTVFKMVRKSDGSPVKARAAAALARDPDPQTTQALVKAVFGNPMLVEVAALGALAKRADPSVINDIMPAMYDSTDEVRFAAAAVVVRLSDVKPGAPVTTSSADKPQE